MTDVGQLIVGSDMACKMMILALYAPSRQRRLITSLLVAPFPEKFGSDSSTSSVGVFWHQTSSITILLIGGVRQGRTFTKTSASALIRW